MLGMTGVNGVSGGVSGVLGGGVVSGGVMLVTAVTGDKRSMVVGSVAV
jgi:hypothetical protein